MRESADGHVAEVTVQGPQVTTHRVRVSRAENERYGGEDVAALVKRSFEFLLAREIGRASCRERVFITV